MPTFIQAASGKNIASTSFVGATATFTGNNVAHSLLVAAVLWFSNTFPTHSDPPSINVTDSRNTWEKRFSQSYVSGGVTVEIWDCLDAGAGANAVAATPGVNGGSIFLSVHEVQPDAGQVFKYNGRNFGSTTASGEITMGSPTIGPYTGTNYTFVASGVDSDNGQGSIVDTPLLWNNRQYNSNSTPINSGAGGGGGDILNYYGALCTFDTNNAGAATIVLGLADGRPIETAIGLLVNYCSTLPVADAVTAIPPGGTYTGPQTITLSQDQGYDMYYTLDGSTPTTSSTHYTSPITITTSKQISVLAHYSGGGVADTVSVFNYSIQPSPPPNSTITITWERRTRVGGSWMGGTGTVPLSEEAELYNLYIMNAAGNVVIRSVQGLTTNSFVYTPAMQFTDFGQYVSSVYVKVTQVSAAVGEGYIAVNPLLGLGGQTAGGGANATQILGDNISGSASDGDILRYNATTSTWDVVGPVLKRQTITRTTTSLANNAAEASSMNVFCGTFGLIKIQVDRDCRVQFYSTAAFRDADASRGYDTDPAVGGENGIIADFGFDSGGAQSWVCSPAIIGANVDGSPVQTLYYRVTNLSGSTSAVAVTITIVPLEIL